MVFPWFSHGFSIPHRSRVSAAALRQGTARNGAAGDAAQHRAHHAQRQRLATGEGGQSAAALRGRNWLGGT